MKGARAIAERWGPKPRHIAKLGSQWHIELQAVSDHFRQPQPLLRLARRVASDYGISVQQLKGSGRSTRLLFAARKDFAERAVEIGKSHNSIARFLGRDHTCVRNYLGLRKSGRAA